MLFFTARQSIFLFQYRGGRNQPRRSFSDRPFNAGRGGDYVTGDSHFQSVRETNLGFRQGETGIFTNHAGSQPPSFRPRPYRQPCPNQNQQFRPSTPNYQGQHFRRSPPPPFGHNHAPRSPPQFRSRPPDYRNWEYAKLARPPSSGNGFVFCYLRVFSGCTSSSLIFCFLVVVCLCAPQRGLQFCLIIYWLTTWLLTTGANFTSIYLVL